MEDPEAVASFLLSRKTDECNPWYNQKYKRDRKALSESKGVFYEKRMVA